MNELKRRKFSRGSREKKTTNKNIITLHMLKFVSILMTFISTVCARLQEIIKNNFGIWKDVQKEEALDRRRKLAWTDLARKRVNLRVTRPAIIVSSLFYSLKPLFLFPAWIFLRKLLRALEKGNAYNDIAGWEGEGDGGITKGEFYIAQQSHAFSRLAEFIVAKRNHVNKEACWKGILQLRKRQTTDSQRFRCLMKFKLGRSLCDVSFDLAIGEKEQI